MNVEELEDKFSKIFDRYNEGLFKLQDLVLEEYNEELTHEYIKLLNQLKVVRKY